MPKRGSGLEVAAARTTFSPKRTMADPPACLASFPVSKESCFPPAISTETFVASGFIDHHPLCGQGGMRSGTEYAWARGSQAGVGEGMRGKGGPRTERVAVLLGDAELGNDSLIPFRVVLLQVVEQASTPAHHHEKSAARAVIFLVRFEVFRQLTDAFTQQSDLDFGTSCIGSVRAIRVNDGLLLLSG